MSAWLWRRDWSVFIAKMQLLAVCGEGPVDKKLTKFKENLEKVERTYNELDNLPKKLLDGLMKVPSKKKMTHHMGQYGKGCMKVKFVSFLPNILDPCYSSLLLCSLDNVVENDIKIVLYFWF